MQNVGMQLWWSKKKVDEVNQSSLFHAFEKTLLSLYLFRANPINGPAPCTTNMSPILILVTSPYRVRIPSLVEIFVPDSPNGCGVFRLFHGKLPYAKTSS